MLVRVRSSRVTIDRKPAARSDSAERIASCLRGDEKAWNDLVDQYGRLVYSIARRYRLADADADDVFQSVFLILLRKLPSLREVERLSAWLITITHRECWRIGKRTGIPTDLDDRIADVNAPSDEQMSTWEQQHLVRLGLERLGGRCETLLTALFMADGSPSYELIADQLGMKVGSIGPTRARCFRKLEQILLDLGLEPPAWTGSDELGNSDGSDGPPAADNRESHRN